jgi:hypothetical protein
MVYCDSPGALIVIFILGSRKIVVNGVYNQRLSVPETRVNAFNRSDVVIANLLTVLLSLFQILLNICRVFW